MSFFLITQKKKLSQKEKWGILQPLKIKKFGVDTKDLKSSGFCTFFFVKNTCVFKQRQKICFNFIKFTYF